MSFFEIWPIRISSILIIFVFKFRCTHTGFPLCRTHEIIVVISTIVFRSINVVTLWKSDKPFLKVVELMNSDILLVRMKLQMLYSKQIISIPAGNLWWLVIYPGIFSFTNWIMPPPTPICVCSCEIVCIFQLENERLKKCSIFCFQI